MNQLISQCNGEAAWGIKEQGPPCGHICHDSHVAENKSKMSVLKHDGVGHGHGHAGHDSELESRGFICSQCCK